jgi:hypothetical protein
LLPAAVWAALLLVVNCGLQNYAMQDALVSAINQRAGSSGPTLYPRACVAAQASSVLGPSSDTSVTPPSVSQYVSAAEAAGQRDLWTDTAPTNMLLLLPGQGVGAVADVVAAELSDAGQAVVTLTLDVVHDPHIVSELAEHPKQTLDEHAHYHFFTPAGVSVDAERFLAMLEAAGGRLPGKDCFVSRDRCKAVSVKRACMKPRGVCVAMRDGQSQCASDCTGCSLGRSKADAQGRVTWLAATSTLTCCWLLCACAVLHTFAKGGPVSAPSSRW